MPNTTTEYQQLVVKITNGPPDQWRVARGEDGTSFVADLVNVLRAEGDEGWTIASMTELRAEGTPYEGTLRLVLQRTNG